MKKKSLRVLMITLIIISAAVPSVSMAAGIDLDIDGRRIKTSSYIENGSTLVPLRVVAEEMDMEVVWNGARREVNIVDGENNIILPIGSKVAFRNDKKISLSVPAIIKTGVTYVPIRFIADSFNRGISWDGESRLVSISSIGNKAVAKSNNYLGFEKDPNIEKIREAILDGKTIVDLDLKDRKNFLARFVREYSYLAYMETGITYTLNSKGETLSVDLQMTDDDFRKLRETDKKVDEIVRDLNLMSSKISDLEKVRMIHDYIIDNAYYAVNSTHSNVYTAYGALIEGKAVCAGYSKAFQHIAHKAGLETIYVSGIANNGGGYESHAWNKVKLDGDWYNIDVTWDDPVSSKPMLNYDYFLKADRELPMHKPGSKVSYPEAIKVKDFTIKFR